MKILVKFPSRERPHIFNKTIREYISNANNIKNIKFLITLDYDCPNLEQYKIICLKLIEKKIDLTYIIGVSTGKISAINRDMENVKEWDICVLASDDMICKEKNWDKILISEMKDNFPNLNGVIWHWDGAKNTKPNIENNELIGGLNTMCIFGLEWYRMFNFIYHPDYVSLFCDNEFDICSRILNKVFYSDLILFKHEHWSNGTQWSYTHDNLMKKEQKFYKQDSTTFNKRKLINFEL